MARVDLSDIDCSIARTLEVVGDRWSLLVLRDLFYGARRFQEFTEDLGIARNTLTDRLRRLEDAGVVRRVPYQERPVRHEYRLTRRGIDLLPVLLTMMRWGDVHEPDADGPPADLVHTTCGEATHPDVVCSHCREPMTITDTRVVPLPPVIEAAVRDRAVAASS